MLGCTCNIKSYLHVICNEKLIINLILNIYIILQVLLLYISPLAPRRPFAPAPSRCGPRPACQWAACWRGLSWTLWCVCVWVCVCVCECVCVCACVCACGEARNRLGWLTTTELCVCDLRPWFIRRECGMHCPLPSRSKDRKLELVRCSSIRQQADRMMWKQRRNANPASRLNSLTHTRSQPMSGSERWGCLLVRLACVVAK